MARRAVTPIRQQLLALTRQSERTLLLGTILLVSALSAVTSFVLVQYYSIDVLSSLVFPPQDCWLDWGTRIGRHCFSDYGISMDVGLRANPWEPYPLMLPWDNYRLGGSNYPAAGLVPQTFFGLLGRLLHAPRLGLLAYLLVLTIALLASAVWAARGARGLERVVVFLTLSVAAIPVWAVIDRGNSVGFVTPIELVFLVGLQRRRWKLVAIMVVLAALVKPQFALLAVALFAARQWRLGSIAVMGVVVSNLAAYLLWPRDLPRTVAQSIHGVLNYGGSLSMLVGPYNVSFGKGILFIPDRISHPQWGYLSNGFLDGARLHVGYLVLALVVVSVLALGRRISPVMVGISLLVTASLFPVLVYQTYLVFALPVAALVVRDPEGQPGSGIFDRFAVLGDGRRAVGICVSLAAALSIAHIALPGPPMLTPIAGQLGVVGVVGSTPIVYTTAALAPIAWMIACAAIIFSYARRPALHARADGSAESELDEAGLVAAPQGDHK
ncbi:membrane protein [Mycobacterium gastri 'Wayne']|nr:membrane protein [Mycobacterium gastri 'Wayne']